MAEVVMVQATMKRQLLPAEAVGPEETQPIRAHPQVTTLAELVEVMPKAQTQTKMRAPVAAAAAGTFMAVVAAAADRTLIFWAVTAGRRTLPLGAVVAAATRVLAGRAGNQVGGPVEQVVRSVTQVVVVTVQRLQSKDRLAAVAAATMGPQISRAFSSVLEAVQAEV